MDRRGLLRGALGVGLAAVTTKLWLPPVSTAVAQPERTIFVPPRGGWLAKPGRRPFSHTISVGYNGWGGSQTIYGDTETNAALSIPPGGGEVEFDQALSMANLQSLVMFAESSDLIVEAEGQDGRRERVLLARNAPVWWARVACCTEKPFSRDIKRLLISNHGNSPAAFRLSVLEDSA